MPWATSVKNQDCSRDLFQLYAIYIYTHIRMRCYDIMIYKIARLHLIIRTYYCKVMQYEVVYLYIHTSLSVKPDCVSASSVSCARWMAVWLYRPVSCAEGLHSVQTKKPPSNTNILGWACQRRRSSLRIGHSTIRPASTGCRTQKLCTPFDHVTCRA